MNKNFITPSLLPVLFALPSVHAEVKVAPVFGDAMVLQCDMEVPIWRIAEKGETVVVDFAGQKKETRAGDDGKWMIRLKKMKVFSEGRDLKVSSGRNPASSVHFSNVVVGEVWVGSGQSNMDWELWRLTRADPVLKQWSEESTPGVRMYDLGKWKAADPKMDIQYSALGFAFGTPTRYRASRSRRGTTGTGQQMLG